MAKQLDIGTVEDRYRRCGLLNMVEHIDIFGKMRSSCEKRKSLSTYPTSFSVVSSSSWMLNRKFQNASVAEKLGKLSVKTKLCSLYPGHDILSRTRKRTNV